MNVICRNPKNYSLTAGRNYRVLQESTSRYTILNDNNSRQNYSKSLFEIVEREEVTVPAPAPPVLPTINSSNVNNRWQLVHNGTVLFDAKHFLSTTQANLISSGQISIVNTEISCGIRQIYNINTLISNIARATTLISEELTRHNGSTFIIDEEEEEDLEVISTNLIIKIFSEIIENKLNDYEAAIYIMSSTTEMIERLRNTHLLGILEEDGVIANYIISDSVHNPNSNNMIQLVTLFR